MKLPESISEMLYDLEMFQDRHFSEVDRKLPYITSWNTTCINGMYEVKFGGGKYCGQISNYSFIISERVDAGFFSGRGSNESFKTLFHIYNNEIVYHSQKLYQFNTVPFCTSEEEYFMKSTVQDLGEDFDMDGMMYLNHIWNTILKFIEPGEDNGSKIS